MARLWDSAYTVVPIEALHTSSKMSRMSSSMGSTEAVSRGVVVGVVGTGSRGTIGSVVSGSRGGYMPSVLVQEGQWILLAPNHFLAHVLLRGLLLTLRPLMTLLLAELLPRV